MAEVVLELGIKKLSTLLSEEGSLLGGLRQEVQLISNEFGQMKVFLEKMDNIVMSQENLNVKLGEWIRQVRDVSYDTQDIIDEFMFLVAEQRLPGLLGSARWTYKSIKTLPARHRLASKLQSVKARIINIAESRVRYENQYAKILSLVTRRVVANNTSRHDNALLVEEAQLVGIDKPKKHLISLLLDDADSQLRAIALLGIGGLGKTTLAKRIYEDDDVKRHFLIRAWVTVSPNWDIQDLVGKLIRNLMRQFKEEIPPEMDSMESHELKAFLKDFLHRGRYVIVFDDVWDTEFWDEMKPVLPEYSYRGNRVIFTTRIAGVAKASTTESSGYVHQMEFLDFEDSWTLFCKKIFKGKHCPDKLKEVAESIVTKCGGLPLCILAMGGLLASKGPSTKGEWELINDILGDEFEERGKHGLLTRIFNLSYKELPSTLKACLLYTSIFPPGQDMPAGYLVGLLVAEGFVEPKGARTVENIAWDCLKELANRSLIQPSCTIFNDGRFQLFEIHDLLRDFIALKSKEQNMVTLITGAQHISEGWHPEKVVRRIVFDNPNIDSLQYIDKCRAVINFGRMSPSKAVLVKLLSSNILTVVDLGRVDLDEIPRQIFNLLQLKFFGIEGKRIKTIPRSIQRLQNLQYLCLMGTSIRELPVEILKLHKLRHIELYCLERIGFKAPGGMGELVELHCLDSIDATGMMSEIGKLTKLRVLCITNVRKEDGEELCTSLNKLNSLQQLTVVASVEDSFNMNHPIDACSLQSLFVLQLFGCLESIPTWIRNLRGLESITLSQSNLAEDPLETLQHLPNLWRIQLHGAYQGELLCFKDGCYLRLTHLRLRFMKGLRRVRIENGAMPGIKELSLEGLPLLEELPVGIQHLRQLQELDLMDVNPQIIQKLVESEEDGEDYQKISHIPQVLIGNYNIGEGRLESRRLLRKKKVVVKKEYQVDVVEEAQEAQNVDVVEEAEEAQNVDVVEEAEEAQNVDVVPTVGNGRRFGTLLLAVAIFCVVLAIVLSFTGF